MKLPASQPQYFRDTAARLAASRLPHLDRRALKTLFSELDPASRALLLSQTGPGVALPLARCRPSAGVLVRRAGPLERAVARVCREAGARVATNVFLRDLNLGMPLSDGRRLEVVANGLPGFGGVQVAVDATLVSPVRRDGTNRPRADAEPGLALQEATDHKRRRTETEFRGAARCRLVVVALEVGGRWGDETEAFL